MHEKVKCEQCHVKPVFTDVGKNCEDCHVDVHNRQMGTNCAECHTVQGWNIAVQEVKAHQNRFPLLGAHAAVQCEDCHKQAAVGQFQGLSTACISCHQPDLNRTQTIGGNVPNHVSANFPTTCETCHTFDSWFGATFNHDTTGFLLRDSHQLTPAGKVSACTDCHIGGNYTIKIAQTDCGNPICHLSSNYGGGWQGTNNPTHSTAGPTFAAANCSNCHNTISFLTATFDHSTTGFPLTNSHQTAPAGKINACTDCHINNNYNLQGLSSNWVTDCGNSICHLTTNYGGGWQGATNPNHSAAPSVFPVAGCATCHNTVSFLTATFDHSTTGFPLTNSHQAAPAGKINACTDCHINNDYNLGPEGIVATSCGNAKCHLNTNYGGGWSGTNNPVHSTAGSAFAAANCATCHNTVSFLTATFDHSTTGFPLQNSHQMAPAGKVNACTDCHISNNYNLQTMSSNWPTDCGNSICHLNTNYGGGWQGTNNPSHAGAPNAYPVAACSTCHNTVSFLTSIFDHSTTGFPLTNSHQLAPAGKASACTDCHINNNYNLNTLSSNWPTDCGNSICHLNTNYGGGWQGTNNPPHASAGPTFAAANCSTCHNTVSFLTATFDHSTTGFPLTNAHQTTPAGKINACTDCHISNNYNLAALSSSWPTDCGNSICHMSTNYGGGWQGTNNPSHAAAPGAYPVAACSTCHNTTSFLTSTFNHSTTGFPLTNSHQLAPAGKASACTDCHINNNYNLAPMSANWPTDCGNSICHLNTNYGGGWQGTNNPPHASAGPTFAAANCSTCHNMVSFLTATFDHSTTGFPLTNAHQTTPAGKINACTDCHINNNYNLQPMADNGNWPTDCQNSICHLNTNYGGGWQGTNNPTHSTAGTPFAAANCSTCHNTVSFLTATFDHSTTGFALTGAHQLAPAGKVSQCSSCHVGNNYTAGYLSPGDCYTCHANASSIAASPLSYASTATAGGNIPNHVAANFPTATAQCSMCHDTVLWTDGKFDHSTTGFALLGPHMIPPRTAVTGAIGTMVNACTDCHIGGNYGTGYLSPGDCYSCHQTYFTNAQTYGPTVPNHVAANYPTTCMTCHTPYATQAWLGAVFNHTWFRIPHHNSVCTDCHINATNYALESCENCHTSPTAHRPGMSHPNVCSPSPACWYTTGGSYGPGSRCYDCHKG